MSAETPRKRVLITGAGGSCGRAVLALLAREPGLVERVVATDLRAPALPTAAPTVALLSARLDVTEAKAVDSLIKEHQIDTVIHLAAVLDGRVPRAVQHAVEVDGTRHILEACVRHGVGQIVYTSSGAAYGYHADSPDLIDEDTPLRGNDVFPYAAHKREAEGLLAAAREAHPGLGQLVLRVATVLGPEVHSPITELFERPVVVGIAGVPTPFCFVAADDVARCIALGVHTGATGVFNLTGEGVMTLREVAQALGRRYLPVPEGVLRRGLTALQRFGIGPYGPEQVLFLQHRPVLSNQRLRTELGFEPRPSRVAFAEYRAARG